MTRHLFNALFVIALGSLGWCLLLDNFLGEHHVLAVELSGLSLAIVWAGLTAYEALRCRPWAAALSMDAEDVMLFGVPCRVTGSIGADAVVLGPIRPTIFVGEALASSLSQDELRAVVYHEDHHRRTLAPIRSAALAAWLRLFGWSDSVQRLVQDRLAHLEVMADVDAMRRGVTPQALAGALLKGEPSARPASFSYSAGERVERLLEHAQGGTMPAGDRLPCEWLPSAVLTIATLACHAVI